MATIGLKDLYYALLTADTAGGATYGTPVKIAGAIQANVNPNASVETLFADDGPMEVAASLGNIEVEMQASDFTAEAQAALLGHTVQAGMIQKKSTDVPPYVAIGFKSLKSNGKYRFVWLLKGKCMPPELQHETKGDSVQFKTPTIKAQFVKRDYDDMWQKQIDEDHVDYVASVGTNWFTAVEGAADTTAPTISSVVPADAATGVSRTSTVVWNFSEAIQASTVTSANFFVIGAADAVVAGTLTINAAKTQVTFTPTAQMAASTQHRAIVTTGVKDIAGNAMANPYVTDFTTAV